ncbi:hypothetical protein BDK92_7324 [Micromonospora pisi]|uniref:Uncharacterized protein n=1 Tax=Micromonospora pisi TaxID=589240 RepID=A0A495JWW1_9ACTN|nr:hypothetical protein [Micromonospora pisi]RKR92842.1 hypothetical protein BDK92_7324 [Micromonospora pisi]
MIASVEQHEPGAPGCAPDEHCWEHHVDETADKFYIVCIECGHVYRTGWELRRAYLRQHWSLFRRDMVSPLRPPPGVDFGWTARWPRLAAPLLLVRALFRRANGIHFCQHCIHDW